MCSERLDDSKEITCIPHFICVTLKQISTILIINQIILYCNYIHLKIEENLHVFFRRTRWLAGYYHKWSHGTYIHIAILTH